MGKEGDSASRQKDRLQQQSSGVNGATGVPQILQRGWEHRMCYALLCTP